jgi:hypothetical protein
MKLGGQWNGRAELPELRHLSKQYPNFKIKEILIMALENYAFYNAVPEDIAEAAVNILQGLNRTAEAIKADSRLTPAAKKQDLAKAYIRAKADMASVKEKLEKDEAASVERLSRRVFGNPATTGADVIAARDADDRAARLQTADEAQAALNRANQNGDKTLARAIALRAHTESQGPFGGGQWGNVLRNYAGDRPGVAEDVAELASMTSGGIQKDFNRQMLLNVAAPGELGRLTDAQIATIAAQE